MGILSLLPNAVDAYGRFALSRMLRCQARAVQQVEHPIFLDSGSLLGAVREGGWLAHDRLSHGNGDVDLGVVVSEEATADLVRQLRAASHQTCGHVVIARSDWLSTRVMSWTDHWGAYGVRSALLRIYSPWAPFVYIDLEDYTPRGDELVAKQSRLRRGDVLPLAVCSFEGLALPCPGNASAVLAAEYGRDWRTPVGRDGLRVDEFALSGVLLSRAAHWAALYLRNVVIESRSHPPAFASSELRRRPVRIAVIGGGMGGLSAAYTLVASNAHREELLQGLSDGRIQDEAASQPCTGWRKGEGDDGVLLAPCLPPSFRVTLFERASRLGQRPPLSNTDDRTCPVDMHMHMR